MAFDGIVTMCMVKELKEKLILGKIEKVYQPDREELVIHIHTKSGNHKLYATSSSQGARVCLIDDSFKNPATPYNFCMLLRKHIQGGRIVDVRQKDSERIIEIDIEAFNELGFSVSKRLIFEIMGKHSNIILLDLETGKIVDSIKRISFDVSRIRQLLPGLIYEYPPIQDKVPFKQFIEMNDYSFPVKDKKTILSTVLGISPSIAEEMALSNDPFNFLRETVTKLTEGDFKTRVYLDNNDTPIEFHTVPLSQYENSSTILGFDTISQAINYFYFHRVSSNRTKQKSQSLLKSVKASIDKANLKKKRLSEDLLEAEHADKHRLYGELLTANLYLIKPGDKSVDVVNYYNEETITIPLNEKMSPSKNSQRYYKKYAKAKTAVKEKQIQLAENDVELEYLNSVLTHIENAVGTEILDEIREELIETGYLRRRKVTNVKKKKYKATPLTYYLSNEQKVLVGKNNKENDYLTTKIASRSDVWMHTKDIPGSHVILPLDPGTTINDLDEATILEAAAIAAYHSKSRASSNVPVDYVQIKYVKKPTGSKPGMVIFTHNKTVYVNPKIPE
ncbi:MAG: NFACT family protein [Peptostreptococcaceae bacterium]|nr:NFACT family protein [Peptostreptococcaceae bacterium]